MSFVAVLVVVWLQTNPAEPRDRAASIYRQVFDDLATCELKLAKRKQIARSDYGGLPVVVTGECVETGQGHINGIYPRPES